ncbi:MAG: hypothetical protein IJ898_02710 [Prevotella sp.]|nr:hypothetical protein [Prevotella sp.]
MRKLFTIGLVLTLAVVTASAQRISCIRPSERAGTRQQYALPEVKTFDPQKTYRQPVILVECSDADFDLKAGGHIGTYFGQDILKAAVEKLCETEKTDFSIYDWDDNGNVDQVLFVAAGYTGNQKRGYIWPNTDWYIGPELPGGVKADIVSVSCELWKYDKSCGIGTILHEFFHCLGLPDFYPLGNAEAFSAVDEWDLMDGNNYTNYGWCPPNLSAMEKMMLGWLTRALPTTPNRQRRSLMLIPIA